MAIGMRGAKRNRSRCHRVVTMARRASLCLFLLGFGISAGCGTQAEKAPQQPPNKAGGKAPSKQLEIAFPEIPGLERTPKRLFEDAHLGYSVAYNSASGLAATIYVYDAGLGPIPDGLSPLVREQVKQAKEDIHEAKRQGLWRSVEERKEEEVALGKGPNAHKVVHVALALDSVRGNVLSDIYLTAYRGSFIKIRCSYPADNRTECEKDKQKLLGALGATLRN